MGDLRLEFSLFNRSTHEVLACRSMTASCTIDYDNLEVLKGYVVSPLPEIVNGDMESLGAWETDYATNFTVRLTDAEFVSPAHSYATSYLTAALPNPGSYAAIYQNFTTAKYPAVVVLSFCVKDSCTSDKGGFLAKQVLLNDRVVWEDEVSGDDRWQHVKVPVSLTAASNKLTLRMSAKEVKEETETEVELPVEVWWDDVKIEEITETRERVTSYFYVLDAAGTEENYPTKLQLGEPAAVIVGIKNNEPREMNYILDVKFDGRLLTTRSQWLDRWSGWEQKVAFIPDKVGEHQKLEFLLFKDRVSGKAYRDFCLWVSTTVNYDDLEPLLLYEIDPTPKIRDGDMESISAWTVKYSGSFEAGSHEAEYTSAPRSYGIKQSENTNEGDYHELSQVFYVPNDGVAVISFDVFDSYTVTSRDAKNITKQVLINDEVLWEDDVSGKDEGYVGWVVEDYDEVLKKWVKRVPKKKSERTQVEFARYQSEWTHVDVARYLREGNNELKLRVYAEGTAEKLPVKVYWDEVEIKALHKLVKTDDAIRMKRYGW